MHTNIKSYIVLDDDDIGHRIPTKRLIKTNSDTGVTEAVAKMAIDLFKNLLI